MIAITDTRAGAGDPTRLGIDDPWRFVANALNDELRSRGATLDEDKFEDCCAYLLVDLCELAARWDPVGMLAARALRDRVAARTASRGDWRALDRYLRLRGHLIRRRAFQELPAAGKALRAYTRTNDVELAGELLSFSTHAYRILRRRYTSYLRDSRGDSRYGMDGREVAVDDLEPYGGSAVDEVEIAALVAQIDHDRLSPTARGVLRELGARIAEGMTGKQAAAALSRDLGRREAAADLKRLRMELAR